jgi:hypothetical protein
MRFEASAQIFNVTFLGVTASSTLTSALADTGHSHLAPYLLALGCLSSPIIAFSYVEGGFYNRKNREKQDRGNNFAKPQNAIDNAIIARNIKAAEEGRTLTPDEREAIERESLQGYQDYHDGIDIE